MLAHTYNAKRAVFPSYTQPKLNGIRAIWLHNQLHSRGRPKEDGETWNPTILSHIQSTLKQILPNVAIDGELYLHGMSLQQINSRVAVKRVTPHDDEVSIEYHIFDLISSQPFQQRASALAYLHNVLLQRKITCLRVVPTEYVQNIQEFNIAYKLYKQLGYEGAMLRHPSAPYGLSQNCTNQENRWTCLLKRKSFLDEWCKIISIEEGEGQFTNAAGSIVLQTPDGVEFKSGTGVENLERHRLWELREVLPGHLAKIRYDELSDQGVPLRSRIEAIDFEGF